MTTLGMDISPVRVESRRRRTAWLTRRGWTGREIAQELRISQRTVERYQAQIKAKGGRP